MSDVRQFPNKMRAYTKHDTLQVKSIVQQKDEALDAWEDSTREMMQAMRKIVKAQEKLKFIMQTGQNVFTSDDFMRVANITRMTEGSNAAN